VRKKNEGGDNMKVISKVALYVAMLLMIASFFPIQTFAETFPDVEGHWAQDEIDYLTEQGLIHGYPDGTFGVSDKIKRGEVAAILARQQELEHVPAHYPDVPEGYWANGEIGAVTKAGMMEGYPEGDFQPEEYFSRSEAAAVLANTFGLQSSSSEPIFRDVETDDWAFDHIQAATDNNLVFGYPDGTFKGEQEITRAEFAVFLARQLHSDFTKEIRALKTSQQVIQALANENMDEFADYVHPEHGVRFSPYVYVKTDHLTFSAEEMPDLLNDPSEYNWGEEDGTGYPIIKTSQEYIDRFVNNKDYQHPDEVVYNEDKSRGSLINNIATYYPDGVFVEYYVDYEEYEGLDWSSLIVVMYEHDGEWYVLGIVNDEWTI